MRISINKLKKQYGRKTVIDIDCLELESGKIYAILGPNGSGKTTLLRILSGLENKDEGEIYYDGMPQLYEGGAAFLTQKPYLFDLSVLSNVLLGLTKGSEDKKKAVHALEHVGMQELLDRKARSLSGGEAQRTALARTLVLEKKLVLLDEPASAVDVLSINLVDKYIKHTNNRDKSTIIVTTHNPSQAVRLADEIIVLWNGEVIEKGQPLEVVNYPKSERTVEFLKNWRI